MNALIQRQRAVIDRSGLGLLPGLALAFGIALLAMLALVLETWWVAFCVLFTLFAITGVIAWVVAALADDSDET